MTRIILHIGPDYLGAQRLQAALAAGRDQLRSHGILFPRSPGRQNHTRLFMAITNPDHVDPLRYNRGFRDAASQSKLRERLMSDLDREVSVARPDVILLSAEQLGSQIHREEEMARLRDLLGRFSADISVVAHVPEPAEGLLRGYAGQLAEGRSLPLTRDLECLAQPGCWWDLCLEDLATREIDPRAGLFETTQIAPFWLDYASLQSRWEAVFGPGSLQLRSYDAAAFAGPGLVEELSQTFDVPSLHIGQTAHDVPALPSAATQTRWRRLNHRLQQLLQARPHMIVPRPAWRSLLNDAALPPGSETPPDLPFVQAVNARFQEQNQKLLRRHPGLRARLLGLADTIQPVQQESDQLSDHLGNSQGNCQGDNPGSQQIEKPAVTPHWREADPEFGFRASHALLAALPQLDAASAAAQRDRAASAASNSKGASSAKDLTPLSPGARDILPPRALENLAKLRNSALAPHNRMGRIDETAPVAPYSEASPRDIPCEGGGAVIVGCMKNEAPYILEWVAYHRAIGVDNFLIYTNGCEDGTSELLDRLQEMGVLQHRNNDNWRGNSPQQFALNQSLKEPIIQSAEWIIHIDVDEFINIRCGNGTLTDLFAAVPDASNIAMTWRLFGHNGQTRLDPGFVIDRFDSCAPKYCPKPHTVWGFKTMFRNIGAYQKISCHRPNKLVDAQRDQVKWVNGSGQDMTADNITNGWRSSRSTIGYDLVQLNHYALRSAESFLIKRQRGRALHVDRSIGLNYWIRMDWNDHTDLTIKRNLPRLRAEYDRLLSDPQLRQLHEDGLRWHRQKAAELHELPEFEELFSQATRLKLTAEERVAYALALDLES
ncbi:glycosyltransferase family 2 protein [Phaeobacter sp.]|uniref:glycosyltransferase family 2 protein n=1 Tax=Phaeobacter sp. TaxID=1902409 RepID=UPI0025CDB06B|nr:glycosyltransferase family 2 protein [Phaeobacter sp.]